MNACRHFMGMYPDNRPSCAKGRNIRAWALRCNGGSNLGIGLRLPCTKQFGEKPLFDCPDLDRRTDEEVEQMRAEMRAKMDAIVGAMPELQSMKDKMIANNLATAKATCPWCEEKDALKIGVALGVNNHMRAHCSACGEGFIE